MDATHATPELFAALAEAQGEIENANKNAANPHFKSKYADLAEVLNTARPVLSRHGLSLIQSTGYDGALVTVSTLLAHKLGGYVMSDAACTPAKSDAQGIGAATTYLRRYALAAMAGIAQEDDDGQSARHDGKPAASKPRAVATDDQRATAADFEGMIGECADDAALQKVGKELAASKLPADLLANLRDLYSARHNALKAAA